MRRDYYGYILTLMTDSVCQKGFEVVIQIDSSNGGTDMLPAFCLIFARWCEFCPTHYAFQSTGGLPTGYFERFFSIFRSVTSEDRPI